MWTCSECGERLDPTFDTCWKCGTSRHPPREQPAAGEQPTPGIGGTVADPARGPGRWHGWMFDRGPSAWRYILRMGVTSLVPSLVVAALLMVTLSLMGRANTTLAPDFKGPPPVVAFIAVVVISPAVETLLLSLGISVGACG